jgi:B9 domain-containing protein 1
MVIYLTSKDSEGEDNVEAYGSVHVPIEPGLHKKQIRMFTPVSSHHPFLEFFGCYKKGVDRGLDGGIHIDAPELIAKAEGREVSRVKAGGKITVTMQVT